MEILKNKKILIGVTGSIAIYKTLELIRLLIKAGAEVKIIMSESSKKFITPLTFETISQNRVLHSETEDWGANNLNHISIGLWADLFIIAPVTANTINKLANGIADTLILQTAIAYKNEILLAPAANTNMLHNHISEGNIKLLKLANYTFIGTETKELACKIKGDGAMASPEEIFFYIVRSLLKDSFWENRRVIVTGGGTIEQIDEVRYISNFSSGKMASALVKALFFLGADVCFISTKFPESLPKTICSIQVDNSQEMYNYLLDSIRVAKKGVITSPSFNGEIQKVQKKPFLFMGSAVSDFKPKFKQNGKLKSKVLGENWNLELIKNIDILKSIPKNGIFTIGFKAEMDKIKGVDFAKEMLKIKNLDAVCLNILENKDSFGSDFNKIDWISKNSTIINLSKSDKLSLSFKILVEAKKLEI